MIREAFGIINAGVEAENLRDLVDTRTVSALPIGGKYRTIDFPLSNMVNSDIRNVGVITSRNYNSLVDHLGSGKSWDLARKDEGLSVMTPFSLRENTGTYRGEVEALRSSLDFIRRAQQEYCVLANAISIYNFNYDDMMRYHIETGADITVLYHSVPGNYKIDSRTREVFFNIDDDGRVRGVEINPMISHLNTRSLKSYIIRKDILIYTVEESFARGEYKFNENLLRNNVDRLKIMAYENTGYVGLLRNISDYFSVNADLLDPKVRDELFSANHMIYTKTKDSVPVKYTSSAEVSQSLVANGCIIEGRVENSVLFRDVRIGKGAVIKNSVLLPSVEVSEGAQLEYVILDKYVNVRMGGRLVGSKDFPVVIRKGGRV